MLYFWAGIMSLTRNRYSTLYCWAGLMSLKRYCRPVLHLILLDRYNVPNKVLHTCTTHYYNKRRSTGKKIHLEHLTKRHSIGNSWRNFLLVCFNHDGQGTEWEHEERRNQQWNGISGWHYWFRFYCEIFGKYINMLFHKQSQNDMFWGKTEGLNVV